MYRYHGSPRNQLLRSVRKYNCARQSYDVGLFSDCLVIKQMFKFALIENVNTMWLPDLGSQ